LFSTFLFSLFLYLLHFPPLSHSLSKLHEPRSYLHSAYKSSVATLPLWDVKGRLHRYMLYHQGKQILRKHNSASYARAAIQPLVHLPAWLLFVWSVRGLIVAYVDGMSTEGTLWFPNLANTDETMLLPILATTSSYCAIHLVAKHMPREGQAAKMIDVLQTALICSTPLLADLPSVSCSLWKFRMQFDLLFNIYLNWVTIPDTVLCFLTFFIVNHLSSCREFSYIG
jgi:hypothetical protein